MTTGTITSESGRRLRDAYAAGNTAVFVGDTNHQDPRYREYITRTMDELPAAGVTDVFLEQPASFQPYVDRFMAAGNAEEEAQVLRDISAATGYTLREDHQRLLLAVKRQNEAARAHGLPETRIHYMDRDLSASERASYEFVIRYQRDERYRHNGEFSIDRVPEGERAVYLHHHRVLFEARERVNEDWANTIAAAQARNTAEGRPSRFLIFGGDGHASRRYDAALAADPRHTDPHVSVNQYAEDLNEILARRGIPTQYWRLERADQYPAQTRRPLNAGNDHHVIFSARGFRRPGAPATEETPVHTVFIPDVATFDAERLRTSREAPPLSPEERTRAEEARVALLRLRQSGTQCSVRRGGTTCPGVALAGSERMGEDALAQLQQLAQRAVPGFRTLASGTRADGTAILEYDTDGLARLDERQRVRLLPVIREAERCCACAARGEAVSVNSAGVLGDITQARALTHVAAPPPALPPAGERPVPEEAPAWQVPEEALAWKPGLSRFSGYMPMILAALGGIGGVALGGFSMEGMFIGLAMAAVGGIAGSMMVSRLDPPQLPSTPTVPQPAAHATTVAPERAPQPAPPPPALPRGLASAAAHVEGVRIAGVVGPIEEVGSLPGGYAPGTTPAAPPQRGPAVPQAER